jgi:hypothetical protein
MADKRLEESYHLPRWPMVKMAFRVIVFMVVGLSLVLITAWWPWNLIGTVPILWGYLEWRIRLKPQLQYVVRLNSDSLFVAGREYSWDELQAIKVEQENGARRLRLTFDSAHNAVDVTISDKLLHYDELVHSCFYRYMAHQTQKPEKKT